MKTWNRPSSLIMACGVVLCALPTVLADDRSDKHFKLMDADADGKVSRAEHAAAAAKMFTECDANNDGTLTAAEMDASMAKRGEKLAKDEKTSADKIEMIDQNSDGKLTTSEHKSGTEKMFGRMDADNDGFLSKDECAAGMKLMKKGA